MDARRIRVWLKRGGILAYPTESCYGLGCDPHCHAAVARLMRLKQRHTTKGLILIAADLRQLRPYLARLTPALEQRMRAAWPGPHTWLVPAATTCPPWLRGDHDGIAVRVTAHADAAQLCRMAGSALVSTSANLSGRKAAKTAAQCQRLFGNRVAVISGRIGTRRRPSTLQDLVSGVVLRK